MSTHLTLEGFRTAAYLEARARMDARKTRGTVKCTPPNTRCGNRCIPPEWDCRLKGEGADPLLAAKRTDPISGIANFERGFNRLGKFARTGSFSQLESSKNSFVRGAVKLKPGNLKEKKEFEQWLKENYAKIAVPLFVAGGLLGGHAILKKGDVFGYRRGVGQKVDNAVSTGIAKVLDAVPFVGQARAYTRRQAASAEAAVQQRTRGLVNLRETMAKSPADLISGTPISSTLIKGNSALTKALNNVNESSSTRSFYEWNLKHQQAFWGASHSRKPLAEDERFLAGRSIYAEPAAQAYINNAWKLNLPPNATRVAYVNTLAQKYTVEADAYLQLAKQQGFRVYGRPGAEYVHRDDRVAFIEKNVRGLTDPQLVAAQSEFIAASISGLSPAARARRRYELVTATFDNYYKQVAKNLEEVAGAPAYDPDIAASGLLPIRAAAERRRIDYMMQAAPARITRKTSAGPAHDRLFLKDYYHTKVAGNERSTYTLSNSEAIRAAIELSGNEIRTASEAIDLLHQNGYKNARLEVRRNPFRSQRSSTGQQTPPPEGGRPARRRRIPDAQVIKEYMAAGHTRAEAEAFLARLKEQRGDSPEDGITAYELAHLIAQSRLDKRCGKSGIPESRKCSKPTPAQSEEARLRAKGAADPGVTCRPGMQVCGNICIPQATTCHLRGSVNNNNVVRNLAKGALVAGAVAGAIAGGRRAYKTRHNNQLYRSSATHISKGIQAMSTKHVRDGISRLPKQWQAPANKLVGKAKVGLAYVAADAQGLKIKHIDPDNNFSTWHNEKTGHVLSIGAVDDTLVTFVSEQKGMAGAFPKFGVAFQTDLSFEQKKGVTKAQSLAVSKQVKSMFQNQLDQLPENAVLFNKPFKDDGLGDKRATIYKRFKFRELSGIRGGEMYALKNQGKLTAIPKEQEDYIAELIRGGDTKGARDRYNNRRRDAKEPDFPARIAAFLLTSKALHEPA